MNRPAISVLMPVYNSEKFLTDAIQSILSQTFSDFEFLIIDDGSTDDSLSICEKFAQLDNRIRLKNRPNTGYVVALNEMLKEAKGTYIARMDSDDISLPDRLQTQFEFMENNPEVVCLGGFYWLVDHLGRKLSQIIQPEDDKTIQEIALSGISPMVHPTVMIRKADLMKAGFYDQKVEYIEDLDLFLRLGEIGKLANLPIPVLHYREHPHSASSKNQELQLERTQIVIDNACDRRGLPRKKLAIPRNRFGYDRNSKVQMFLRNGWMTFNNKDRKTSAEYAFKALGLAPWNIQAWKLLYAVCFKM